MRNKTIFVVINTWPNMLAPSEIQAVGFETSHLICIERIGVF